MPLDPRVKRFLDTLAAMNPSSALTLSVAQRRRSLQDLMALAGRPLPVEHVDERQLPGSEADLRVRVYTPPGASSATLPGLLYFHGGGLVAGDLDTHDGIARELCRAGECRVVSVDYRLAPEARFPAAVEDAEAATGWLLDHAPEVGVDPARIGICGDSAGGTLATVVCQRAAARGDARVRFQLLLCPILDYGATTPSRREFARGYFVDEDTLAHDLRHYLGANADASDPRVSPLRAAQLMGLPPTAIHSAECDPLRDEAQAYAERLRAAGVPTTYDCHSGMIHLFYGMGRLLPHVTAAFDLIGTQIRSGLAAQGSSS